MRPVPAALVEAALVSTSPYVLAHGGPIHCGDPAALGIAVRGKKKKKNRQQYIAGSYFDRGYEWQSGD